MSHKYFIIMLVCAISFPAHAQITVTSDDVPAQPGTKLMYYEGWVNFSLDVVSSGPNQTWDFQLADTLDLVFLTEELRDPSTSPFPDANHFSFKDIQFFPGTHDYKETYSTLSEDGLIFRGFRLYNNYMTDTSLIKMEPGLDYIHFPCTYGLSWSEEHTMSGYTNGEWAYSDSIRGEYQIDGWGTVLTPYGSFECLRMLTKWSDFNEETGDWQVLDTTLAWMAHEVPMVFLIEQYGTDTETGMHFGWFRIYHSMILDVEDKAEIPAAGLSLEVFPNPMADQVHIDFRLNYSGKVSINAYDSNGKQLAVVADAFYNAGQYKISWIPPFSAKGMVIITLSSGSRHLSQKLCVPW